MNLTAAQIDALTECINIGMGHSAGILHDMLGTHIALRVPEVKVVPIEEVSQAFGKEKDQDVAAVRMQFTGSFQGSAVLLLPGDSVRILARCLAAGAEPEEDMDALRSGMVIEVGNIILNGVMGSIVNLMKAPIQYTVPYYSEGRMTALLTTFSEGPSSHLIIASTTFEARDRAIQGFIVIVFEISFIRELVAALDRMLGAA